MSKIKKLITEIFRPALVETRQGDLEHTLEVRRSGNKYILDSSRANYSFAGLHSVMQKAFSFAKVRELNPSRVLILGFGAGSCASILENELNLMPNITGVEGDNQVIEFAKKYFNISRYKGLKLVHQDALEFVVQSSATFDLIVVDVFIDLNVPEKFYSEKFLQALRDRLAMNGKCIFNVVIHSPLIRQRAHKLFEDLNSIVGSTEWHRIHSSGTENWVFETKKVD